MNTKITKGIIVLGIVLSLVRAVMIVKEEVEVSKKDEEYKEYDKKVIARNLEITNYIQNIRNNRDETLKGDPYIPEGFRYVEGNVEDGYVIEDESGNQFVWIPCSVYNSDDNVILDRYKLSSEFGSIDKEDCIENSEDIFDFIDSVYKYNGFYVARYEAGEENGEVVSKKGIMPIVNVVPDVATEKSKSVYELNDEVSSSLMNSYAWDTMIKWILSTTKKSYQDEVVQKFESGCIEIKDTGIYSMNNIYDIASNVAEYTTEVFECDNIIRSVTNLELEVTAGYRGVTLNVANEVTGFRFILYKK